MSCVFAIGPCGEEGALGVLREALEQSGYTVTGDTVLIVECPWGEVAWLAGLIVGVPYESRSAECPVETLNALTEYWSREKHPVWHANEDWFQAHKHEFEAGEFIIVQECALKLRTRNRRECFCFLETHPDRDTALHEMVADGREMQCRV